MNTSKKNWKIIAIVTTVIGVMVGVAMIFWDRIEDIYYKIGK